MRKKMKRKRNDPPKGAVEFKAFGFDTKAVAEAEPDDDGLIEFDAYGSVFGNIDSHGDVVHKGAYADTLADWAEKNAPIPSYYNHGAFSNDPHDNVGFLSLAQEDDHGLKVRIALDVGHNPKAAYAHRLVKQGRLRELSVGYIAKEWSYEEDPTAPYGEKRNLLKVDLLEVSVVSVASNPLATVTSKAASLVYGAQDNDEGDDDAEGGDKSEGSKKELDDDAAADLAETLRVAAETLTTVVEGLTAIAENLDDGGDPDEDPDGGDDPAADDSGQEVGAKSLSARARAALALTALHGAGTE